MTFLVFYSYATVKIGFTESSYTTNEGNNTVVVCVAVLQGESIITSVAINLATVDSTATCE